MKRSVFYLISAAALAAVGCSGNSEFVINGTTDTNADMVYLIQKREAIDSAAVVDGKFQFKVAVDENTPGLLYVSDKENFQTTVFPEKGTVTLSVAEGESTVAGTPTNDKYQAYLNKSNDLYAQYRAADPDGRDVIYDQMEQLDQDLFTENTDNYIGVMQLQQIQYSMEAEELEAALAKIDPKYAQTQAIVSLTKRVELLKKTAVGQPYINVALADRNGKTLSLSDYVGEGKYVLLDFWASWCGPCMRELPYLLKSYANFHKKGFEIFGVSLDQTKEPWLKAVDENKMDWIHVSDLKYWDCEGAKLYGVNAIPANYLIGPDGKIVAKDLRGEALDKKLAEILGE